MTDQVLEELREKDQVVLECIGEGRDDTQKITEATTLETHEVRYSLKKLEQLGLVTLEKPDEMVERVVDGQKRVFKAPLKAQFTEIGETILNRLAEGLDDCEDMTHEELVRRVDGIEQDVNELQGKFETFRKQVLRKLDSQS